MLEVRLTSVRVDLPTRTPVVLLQEVSGERSLPIYIGAPEATAIAFAIQHQPVPRPMTHDLMKDLVEAAGISVDKVVVTEVRGGTYYAEIHLHMGERQIELSSRPSDAIALAARIGCPLYVEDDLMEEAGIILEEEPEPTPENSDELVGEFLEFLDTVRPEDFSG